MDKKNTVRLSIIIVLVLCVGVLIFAPKGDNARVDTGNQADLTNNENDDFSLEETDDNTENDKNLNEMKEQENLDELKKPLKDDYEVGGVGGNDTELELPDLEESKKPESPSNQEESKEPVKTEKPSNPQETENPSRPEQPSEPEKKPDIEEGLWTDPF